MDAGTIEHDRKRIEEQSLDKLFRKARTLRHWIDRPVTDETLRTAYELARMGPSSGNANPLRLLFARTAEAKERLKPCLDAGNVRQTMEAPVTAIVAWDSRFYEYLPRLRQRENAADGYAGDAARIEAEGKLSAALQAGYFIMACRSLGLDCGPMGGFDPELTDKAFFPDGRWRSTFLINIGYGDWSHLRPRAPRLEFDEACRVA